MSISNDSNAIVNLIRDELDKISAVADFILVQKSGKTLLSSSEAFDDFAPLTLLGFGTGQALGSHLHETKLDAGFFTVDGEDVFLVFSFGTMILGVLKNPDAQTSDAIDDIQSKLDELKNKFTKK